MSKISLTAGQIGYWRNKLGQDASSGSILKARTAKVGGNAPAAAPAPTQAPAGGPAQPFDPVYEQTVAATNRNLGNADTEYDYQKGRTKQLFGIEDQSDPFSRQAILNQQYGNQQRDIGQGYTDRSNATTTGMAAQGQGSSSAAHNAQGRAVFDRDRMLGDAKYNYDANSAQLGQQYQDILHNLTFGNVTAHTQGENVKGLAAGTSLQTAIATPPDPNAVAPPAAKPKTAGKTAAKPSLDRATLLRIARSLNLR